MKRKVKLAKCFLIVAFSILFLLSFRPFSNYLLWGLESKYPPLEDFKGVQNIKYIVLLTAWAGNRTSVPYTSNLGYKSAFRVLEAHRIYMHMPESKIIISGGKNSTQLMTKLLVMLGVPGEQIILEDQSKTTWESAVNIKKLIANNQFILVTSAVHLPRSIISFTIQNLNPVPAPANFLYGNYRKFQFPVDRPLNYYVPNIESYANSNIALYEYSGLLWYYVKTLILEEDF